MDDVCAETGTVYVGRFGGVWRMYAKRASCLQNRESGDEKERGDDIGQCGRTVWTWGTCLTKWVCRADVGQ